MQEYWPKRLFRPEPTAVDAAPPAAATEGADPADEYDRARLKRLQSVDSEDGWKHELQRYLDDPARDVKRDTDTVQWWSVSYATGHISAL